MDDLEQILMEMIGAQHGSKFNDFTALALIERWMLAASGMKAKEEKAKADGEEDKAKMIEDARKILILCATEIVMARAAGKEGVRQWLPIFDPEHLRKVEGVINSILKDREQALKAHIPNPHQRN